jgi:glucose dehydrogenase
VPVKGSTEVWGSGSSGGSDFMPMSFDPQTNDLYVCTNGQMTGAGSSYPASGIGGYVTALNVTTNTLDWQHIWPAEQYSSCFSGVLATAGGVVFTASLGQPPRAATSGIVKQNFGGSFYAYDAITGKQLFQYLNSSIIMAPPITYQVGGKQYVAIDMSGGVFFNSPYLPSATSDKLTVFQLP